MIVGKVTIIEGIIFIEHFGVKMNEIPLLLK